MTNISLTLTDEIINKMDKFYDEDKIQNNNPYARFIAKADKCTVTAFKSGKVLFQGENAAYEAGIWQTANTSDDTEYYKKSIGSDEVGTGDYFGPVVVVACFVSPETVPVLKSLNIDDSKKLDDQAILNTAPALFKLLPHSLLSVDNDKYNEEMAKPDMNLNKMKALLHRKAIQNLMIKINASPDIIIDQFCDATLFAKYTTDKTFTQQVYFTTKAESKYASVACASMMARYYFLKEMDKLSLEVNTPLLKGASGKVDMQGKMLVGQYGTDILKKIAKLHFKNTDKILTK